MNYISLDELKNAWIFKHNSLIISDSDKSKIKPMSVSRANVLWDNNISKQVDHPDFFKKGDWPFNSNTWQDSGKWESIWDSEDSELPKMILTHLAWDNNTVVYYCTSRNYVIETTWAVFKRCWKNFLFMDDGAILLAKRRTQAVQFLDTGYFKIGTRSN
ncbi:Protein of unknown function [Colwellia chukchiensis]|uniref:DUF2947 domain-containing protein n=1 Tax=Colwellia chukchiensis TaxID=641665 RepID=A0A1H7QG60_9GAMM|nr:DUF2947 family protein [Colwellia chukchiensis]SEL46287.1 Protein of unknown function [Colwellia chukchiensis]